MTKYVQIENVQMVFDTRKGPFVALQDINLHVRQGEVVALIGHSGCGKSTLLNLIAGLTTPTNGVLLAAGRDARAAHDLGAGAGRGREARAPHNVHAQGRQ